MGDFWRVQGDIEVWRYKEKRDKVRKGLGYQRIIWIAYCEDKANRWRDKAYSVVKSEYFWI